MSKHKHRYLLILFLSCPLSLLLLDILYPLPLPSANQYSLRLLTKEGQPLRSFPNATGNWCYPISLSQVSPRYLEALLTYEDRWFWWHPGVNPLALLRASWQLLKNRRIISGGSTLTMQVARLLDPHSRTFTGKLKQILRAFQLEWHLTKTEILTLYLNLAPFGGPLEGIQAASLTYLGKSPATLSHAEAALLAILPQSPTRLRPDRNPQQAEIARNKVLDRLGRFKIWSPEILVEAKQETVDSYTNPPSKLAPLLSQRLKNQVSPHHPLITTLDHNLQTNLETQLAAFASELPDKTSIALLVVENANLKVRAYVGSINFLDAQRFGQIDMIQAPRSPGSTLKPFLYGFALEAGLIHSESLLLDVPQTYGTYQPSNFDEGHYGPVSARVALQNSLNIPAVDLLSRLTPELFSTRLRQGGIRLTLPLHARPNLSLILGGTAARLEELVSGYAALARKGLTGPLRFTEDSPLQERFLLSAGAAWIIHRLLSHQRRPDLLEQQLAISSNRQVAWKTGTSYGYRDAWAIGVTPQYTVGIWVGRPDGTPMPGYYGAITAAPILFNIIDGLALQSSPTILPIPPSVTQVDICWPTGRSVHDEHPALCHEHYPAWILDQQIPPTLPDSAAPHFPLTTTINLNPHNGLRVNAHCPTTPQISQTIARWPLSAYPWLTTDRLRKTQLPDWDPSCAPAHSEPVKIVGLEKTTLLRQTNPHHPLPVLSLSNIGGEAPFHWLINGKVVASTVDKSFRYQFKQPGQYKITLIEQGGHYDQITVRVIH